MGTGLLLKEILRERGMTIKSLAQESGISVNTLYSITKRDSNNVDSIVLKKIAAVLNCEPNVLSPSARQSTPESRRKIEDLMGKEPGFLDGQLPTEKSETGKRMQRVKDAFDVMSQDGQEEATRRVEELARLPEYQKKESPSLSSLWGFDKRGEQSAVDPQENDKGRA